MGLASVISPDTRKMTTRGPSASQAARKLPGPESSRFVTKITLPPLPPGVVEPNPSAPGNDGIAREWFAAEVIGVPVGSAKESPKRTRARARLRVLFVMGTDAVSGKQFRVRLLGCGFRCQSKTQTKV